MGQRLRVKSTVVVPTGLCLDVDQRAAGITYTYRARLRIHEPIDYLFIVFGDIIITLKIVIVI